MNLAFAFPFVSLALVLGLVTWTNVVRPFPPLVERLGPAAAALLAAGALFAAPGPVGGAVAAIALVLSSFLFLLTFMSRLPRQRASVDVGRPAPDFRGLDANGQPFQLAQLRGSRVLLKFYRGTWCPYCVSDLTAWNAMREQVRALGLNIVAVSHDSPDELARLQDKHHLSMTLVADPTLAIIRLYNLQNRNFTPKKGPFRDMAIPATILIGEDGRVLWMEQATDFRLRSRPAVVLAAIRAALERGAGTMRE